MTTRPEGGDGLRAEALCHRIGGRQILRSVSLVVRSGEVVGLLGANGAGKTTTFYAVVGMLRPEQGRVLLDGRDLTDEPMHRRARLGISYLPQEPSVFRNLSVADNLRAILETLPLSRAEQDHRLAALLAELGISHLAASPAYALSGGERRRLEISRALVTQPQFILLDEPFAGIDPLAILDIQEIVRQLRQKGIGILITDHNVRETLGICDRAYILNEGAVLEEGRPEAIASSPRARQLYLGENFRL